MRFAAFGQAKKEPDIRRILHDKDLTAHFQQVVYMTRQTVCGLEGLIRGFEGGAVIPPKALFDAAAKKGLTMEFDRLCREKVLEAFGHIYQKNTDKLLFINLDASVLDIAGRDGYLLEQVEKAGINPNNIVVEINETKVLDKDRLKSFMERYRTAGFLIALDDVGAGFSNLDRIPIVKPDIIKVDISLIRRIQDNHYKREVVKSLIRLATQIGAMVVAEGVETQEEAMETLRLGVNMIQGFYFSRPAPLSEKPFANGRLADFAEAYKQFAAKTVRQERRISSEIAAIARKALAELSGQKDFDKSLRNIVGRHTEVECAYVLDDCGLQCSDTVFGAGRNKTRENLIFYSARHGADHSMKSYYCQIAHGKRGKYISEPYVSLATGSLCVTFAETFKGADNKRYILCMDFCGAEGNGLHPPSAAAILADGICDGSRTSAADQQEKREPADNGDEQKNDIK